MEYTVSERKQNHNYFRRFHNFSFIALLYSRISDLISERGHVFLNIIQFRKHYRRYSYSVTQLMNMTVFGLWLCLISKDVAEISMVRTRFTSTLPAFILFYFFQQTMPILAARASLLFSFAQPLSLRGLAALSTYRSIIASSSCSPTEPKCPSSRHSTVRMATTTAPAVLSSEISGPNWILEYASLDAPALNADIDAANEEMALMESLGKSLGPLAATARDLPSEDKLVKQLVEMHNSYYRAVVLLRNIGTYASCVSSVNGTDAAAKKLSSSIQSLFARCRASYEPASLILDLCPDNLFQKFLAADKQTASAEFILRHSRQMADHRLSLEEENMITGLQVTGHSAWATMYSDLSSVIPVHISQPDGSLKSMGIATAEAMRDSPDEDIRRKSWEAIREAWLPHQETCAAALNAITGWRLDLYERRQLDSPISSSLHMNRMSQATLEALFTALDASSDIGRRALRIQAKCLGKDSLEPWDLFAPAPSSNTSVGKIYTFDEGIDLIAKAIGAVDEEGGNFVRMMQENKWIEASRGDKKRPGA